MVNSTTCSEILTTCEPLCASLFHTFPMIIIWTVKSAKDGYCSVLFKCDLYNKNQIN